jgi:hypothetical protein
MSKKEEPLEFPDTDGDFHTAFTQLMTDLAVPDTQSSQPLVVSYVRLGININTVYNPLVALMGTPTTADCWASVYPAEKTKGTHDEVLTLQKNTIKGKALKLIRAQRIILKAQETISPGTLTALDKKVWYIDEPNPITPSLDAVLHQHPVPALTIHETRSLQHTLDAVNPDSPKSRSMPEGMQFIWIKRFIGATAPTDPELYATVGFSGRFRSVSNFSAVYKRQQVWYIACYLSTTGVIGNFCDPISGTVA